MDILEKLQNIANNPFAEDEGVALEAISEIKALRAALDDLTNLKAENGGYWGEHKLFPAEDWAREVEDGSTRQGYWNWVQDHLTP